MCDECATESVGDTPMPPLNVDWHHQAQGTTKGFGLIAVSAAPTCRSISPLARAPEKEMCESGTRSFIVGNGADGYRRRALRSGGASLRLLTSELRARRITGPSRERGVMYQTVGGTTAPPRAASQLIVDRQLTSDRDPLSTRCRSLLMASSVPTASLTSRSQLMSPRYVVHLRKEMGVGAASTRRLFSRRSRAIPSRASSVHRGRPACICGPFAVPNFPSPRQYHGAADRRMTDEEFELRLLERYVAHHEGASLSSPGSVRCTTELDMRVVIRELAGRTGPELDYLASMARSSGTAT